MGLAHGGLRQKNFNMYEEALRIPLVYSNPRLFDGAIKHNAPRLARRLPADAGAALPLAVRRPDRLEGHLLRALGARPRGRPAAAGPHRLHLRRLPERPEAAALPGAAEPLVAIREKRWKLARYYDIENSGAIQYEMYDRRRTRSRQDNLAFKPQKMTANQKKQFRRLKKKLDRIENNALAPLPDTPQPLTPPSNKGTIGNITPP